MRLATLTVVAAYPVLDRANAVARNLALAAEGMADAGARVVLITQRVNGDPGTHPRIQVATIAGPTRPKVLAYLWFRRSATSLTDVLRKHTDPSALIVLGVEGFHSAPDIAYCNMSTVAALGLGSGRSGNVLERLNLALHARVESEMARRQVPHIVPSGGVAADLRQIGLKLPVAVVPNPRRGAGIEPHKVYLRRISSDGDEFVWGFLAHGRFGHKGLDIVLRAFAINMKRQDHIRSKPARLVVGGGSLSTVRRYRRRAAGLGLSAHVQFLGSLATTEDFWQMIDGFVYPSLYESFSSVLEEAALHMKAIVTTRTYGNAEAMLDAEGAEECTRAPESVAHAMRRVQESSAAASRGSARRALRSLPALPEDIFRSRFAAAIAEFVRDRT